MEELIKILGNIEIKDIEELMLIYDNQPDGIIKDSMKMNLIYYNKMIGKIINETENITQ